jgi:signal transduction histidine kinase
VCIECKDADIVALVSDAVESAQARSDRMITVTAPPSVRACIDALRLEAVVGNLLDNAVKFSPADRLIEVEVRAEPADRFTIVVRDHGIGVPESDRARLFDRYFQGAHQRGGMGLGLTLSREIVERHGGTLAAEFPPDGGTRMIVTIPITSDVKGSPP